MLTVSTPQLELNEAWIASDERGRVHPAFPINQFTGAKDTAVVYFEVEPGEYLHPHRQRRGDPLHRRRRGRGPVRRRAGPCPRRRPRRHPVDGPARHRQHRRRDTQGRRVLLRQPHRLDLRRAAAADGPKLTDARRPGRGLRHLSEIGPDRPTRGRSGPTYLEQPREPRSPRPPLKSQIGRPFAASLHVRSGISHAEREGSQRAELAKTSLPQPRKRPGLRRPDSRSGRRATALAAP